MKIEKKVRRDIKAEVTDTIIAALEEGVAPWTRSWTGGIGGGLPSNISTEKQYRGINVFLLWISADRASYPTNEWATYRQAEGMGAQVRGGEKGTQIAFWGKTKREDKVTGEEKEFWFLKQSKVFNRAQIDGLPEVVVEEVTEATRHERAEALIASTGATVNYGLSRAYYSPSTDAIGMPSIEQFNAESEYYSTHLHELIHWTSHATRLDRATGLSGTDAYGHEELVAELGAAFTCAEVGIEGKLQHAEYLGAWIKNLKADKNAIFAANSAAQKATDFLLGHEAGQEEVAA
tara:strand:- start:6727 stop:7599 length:873 start_codon:yes stop_codon:yes gene_type:complete